VTHHEFHKPTDVTIPKTSLLAKLPLIGAVLAVVGLGATVGLGMGEHKARALFSYLFAYEYALSIALGALGFVLIQHAVRAGWSTVVRRIAETLMLSLPLFAVLFIPIAAFGLHTLFPWTHETDAILERKRWWLTDGGFLTRAGIYFLIWGFLAYFMYSRSTKQDDLPEGSPERDKISRSMWGVAALGLFLYVLTLTGQSIDWLKSLTPHWYSTMWGVYYFAGAMISFYSLLALLTMWVQKSGALTKAVTTEHFHDIGKFMFGHTVFWAYIGFSQFMLQWYANMPEETVWWMHRVEGGWENVTYLLPLIHFFIPFLFLLSRHVKRNRTGLAIGAVYILVVHAIDMYWIVMPNAVEHGHPPHFAPHALDFTAFIGVVGIVLAWVGFWLNRKKVIAVGDPRLEESMAHENY
jgi:hypothetical protein